MTGNDDWQLIQDLYAEGLQSDPADRTRLLNERCPDRPDLQAEVEALWRHGEDDYSPVDFDPVHKLARGLAEQPATQQPGDMDRYRIMETIGQGGMGVVYKAEQRYPVQRPVALKILPLGSCTPERLLRFQAEQRALALIDHPNVVTVYDCGETPEGQPYYTMDYLEGSPITQWCDRTRANLRLRLTLFMQVCKGLARAHRKGIIHRDINPSNVLVTDQGPTAKIIDFGIARFKDGNQLQEPARTAMGMIMGTPGYMSPEQAAGAGEEAVDTLSDIYAAGALLYELVTGVTPLGEAKVDSLEELVRAARNHLPPPPASHLRTGQQSSEDRARNRSTTVKSLRKELEGELAWIIMKAIAHNPRDRYANCDDLVRDIERYLQGLPLEAGPPNPFYKWRKLLLYHRRAVLVGASFLAVLLLAMVLISAAFFRASEAESRVRAGLEQLEAVQDFTLDMFNDVNPVNEGDVTGVALLERAETRLDRYRDQPQLEAATRVVLGYSFKGLGRLQEARRHYQRALALHRETDDSIKIAEIMEALAYVTLECGDLQEARDLYQESLKLSPSGPGAARAEGGLAQALSALGKSEEATRRFVSAMKKQKELLEDDHAQIIYTRNNYAAHLLEMGQITEAQPLLYRNLEIMQRRYDPDHPLVARTLHNLAFLIEKQGDKTALSIYRDVWERRTRTLGRQHPETLSTLNNMAVLMGARDNVKETLMLLETALADLPLTDHPIVWRLNHNLGHFLMAAGRNHEAAGILECTLMERRRILGENHPSTLRTWWTLAEATNQPELFPKVLQTAEIHLGPNHPDTRLYRAHSK